MALVGDAIMACRRLIPDMPQPYAPPTLFNLTPITGALSLPLGIYFAVVTWMFPWGETLPSGEQTITIAAGEVIQINPSFAPSYATGLRIYLTLVGGASGSEAYYQDFPVTGGSEPAPVVTAFPKAYQLPPTASGSNPYGSAYNPDSDGTLWTAAQAYYWLNRGIEELSRRVEGLRDYTGVGSVAGQSMYTILGQWTKYDSCWYDGYPFGGGKRGDFFRHNSVTSGVLAAGTVSVMRDQIMFEVYPQPARTSAQTTLTSGISSTATAIPFSTAGVIATAMTLFQIGNEVVACPGANVGGAGISNAIRGLGGAVATAWPAGTPVVELNISIHGYRIFTPGYVPGNADLNLPVPSGWDTALTAYLLSKARKAEQDEQGSAASMKEFTDFAASILKQNKIMTRQGQCGTSPTLQVYFPISYGGGGVIIP